MTAQFKAIFSSFILIDQLENDLDNDAILAHCYHKRNDDQRIQYEGGWSSGHLPLADLDSEPLAQLKTEINKRIAIVREELGVKPNVQHEIRNYWANIFSPTGRYKIPAQPPHIHANYFLSCVYYPKAEERAGDIVLMCPFNAMESTLPFKHIEKHTFFNASRWIIKPEPAKLIIFPSWIMHYVEDNNSDADRVSMAFNISLPQVDL